MSEDYLQLFEELRQELLPEQDSKKMWTWQPTEILEMPANVSSADLLQTSDGRYGLFANSMGLPAFTDNALWIKRAYLYQLTGALCAALKQSHLSVVWVIIRPILEHIAVVHQVRKDLDAFELETDPKVDMRLVKAQKIYQIVAQRLASSKLDLERTISSEFTSKKQKLYKPKSNELNVAVESGALMKTIDELQKTIPGVRKTYDIASEFAHPNQGAKHPLTNNWEVWQSLDKASTFVITDVSYAGGSAWDELFLHPSLDIVGRAIKEFFRLESEVMSEVQEVGQDARRVLHQVARKLNKLNQGPIFDPEFPCPCLRGNSFGNCCGRQLV
jgi:hypothetical protein